jgi:prepilin-type N-terminal cleavage/methylation domain-containing protein
MIFRTAHPTVLASRQCLLRSRRAFSLIEVLIATALMSVIVLGLLIMFGQTQRAFRTGVAQVDVLEAGRSALEMIARDVEQAAAAGISTNCFNLFINENTSMPPLRQDLVGGGERTNFIQNLVFLSREGQEWSGIGYGVLATNYIGTLYRYETNASVLDSYILEYLSRNAFNNKPSRVIDGVVHLRVQAYDHLGRLLTSSTYGVTNAFNPVIEVYDLPTPQLRYLGYEYRFTSNALPAHLEIELGILEPKYAERVRNIPVANAQLNYLRNQVGHVQIFRQRVAIRNADPSVFQ